MFVCLFVCFACKLGSRLSLCGFGAGLVVVVWSLALNSELVVRKMVMFRCLLLCLGFRFWFWINGM